MNIFIHTWVFGSPSAESMPIQCPNCPSTVVGANWEDVNIDDCYPGQKFKCASCGKVVTINWGLTEPDHLSTWLNWEKCPHFLCQKKKEMAFLRDAVGAIGAIVAEREVMNPILKPIGVW